MVDRGSVKGAAVDLAVRVCRPGPPPGASGAPLFGALTQASAAVIVVVSEDGWTPVSDAFGRTLGYAEPPDVPLVDLVHPDDRGVARVIYHTCLAGQTVAAPVDLRIAAADNSWRTMEIAARAIAEPPTAPAPGPAARTAT